MYGLIYTLTIILIIDHRIIPSRLFPIFWLTVMIFLSLSIRWNLIQTGQVIGSGDMAGYVSNMKLDGVWLSYHYREPVYWFGTQYLYKIIGNPGLVFVVTDIILFLTFYKAVGLLRTFYPKPIRFENLKYLYFGAFLVYPYLTGMHNHYRQILAVTIAMYAIGLAGKDLRKAYFLFIVSILIHNAAAVLFPIIMLAQEKRYLLFNSIALLVLSIMVILFIPSDTFYEITRRINEVGARSGSDARTEIYLYLLLFSTFVIFIIEYGFKWKVRFNLLIQLMGCMTAIYFVSLLAFSSQPAGRVFFMILTMLYIFIGMYVDVKFNTGSLKKLLYFHLSLIPLLGLQGDGLVYEFF